MSQARAWCLCLFFSAVALNLFAQEEITAPRVLPGQMVDGRTLLPNQWSLLPAGNHIEVGDFPVNIAIHPDGHFAAVLHCGFSKHEIVVIDLKQEKAVSRTPVEEAFYGLVFSNDGKRIFCSGASQEGIRSFTFKDGVLDKGELIPLHDLKEKGIPAGLAIRRDGSALYAANVWGQSVSIVDLETQKSQEVKLSKSVPTVVTPPPKDVDFDTAAANKRDEAARLKTMASEPFPYACVLDEKKNRLLVSLWAQSSVAVIDLDTKAVITTYSTEEHPNEMLLTKDDKTLFVANANRNTVSVIDTESGTARETLYAALYPNLPPGITPSSLALTPDEKTLFVANATINCLAVFDVSETGKSHPLGFIPTGWYPTSVRITPDGKKLIVANGKGLVSKANPHGPKPGVKQQGKEQYIGSLLTGAVSVIKLPKRDKLEESLKVWSAQVYQCSPLHADLSPTGKRPDKSPIPEKPGDPSPIKYCIYVVKENRTYDQILGDMKEGNGDPNLCLFPEKVTPNLHKISREFVLLDNFYVDAEVSADGHEWTTAAYATDFVEKSWPMAYGHNKSGKFPYPSEGNFAVAYPSTGYIWDRAKEAGVTYRSYGEFVSNGRTPNDPASTKVPALQDHFDPKYRSFDLNYPEAKRLEEYTREFKAFEEKGEMPRFQIVRFPNDHTNGTAVGKQTPTAYVAENDLAVGQFVELISHSKFWPETAIFILEDDAQNGSDHVDAHRSTAYVISPYTKRNTVDSTMYSTSSMLRTMELILGLKPMTHYDAAATPMYGTFQADPNPKAYDALPAQVDITETNQKTAWGAAISEKMDFTREDAVNDLIFNEIIWHSVKGAESAMPPPTRAAFVFTHAKADKDDD